MGSLCFGSYVRRFGVLLKCLADWFVLAEVPALSPVARALWRRLGAQDAELERVGLLLPLMTGRRPGSHLRIDCVLALCWELLEMDPSARHQVLVGKSGWEGTSGRHPACGCTTCTRMLPSLLVPFLQTHPWSSRS